MERVIQELRIWLSRRNIPLDGIEVELIVPNIEVENQVESAIIASQSPDNLLIRDSNQSDRTVIMGIPVTIRAGARQSDAGEDPWQSINTAPTDGTPFLVRAVGGERTFMVQAWYEEGVFKTALDELVISAAAFTHWTRLPVPPRTE
jgi:hypothetical protein